MRLMILLCASVATLVMATASAEIAGCPYANATSCEEWQQFAQLDKELAELVAGPSDWIDGMPAQLRDEARAALTDAHTQWVKFRDAECRRILTREYMTAVWKPRFLNGCLVRLTSQRRDELESLYKFRPR